MRPFYCVATLATCSLAACAAPLPVQRMEASTAAIRAAEEVGAAQVPTAALHLQLAKEQSALGQSLVDSGERERAGYVFMRAEGDANLAVALARSAHAQAAAKVAKDKLRDLEKSDGRQP